MDVFFPPGNAPAGIQNIFLNNYYKRMKETEGFQRKSRFEFTLPLDLMITLYSQFKQVNPMQGFHFRFLIARDVVTTCKFN